MTSNVRKLYTCIINVIDLIIIDHKFVLCNDGQNPPQEFSNNLASIEKVKLQNGQGVFVFNPNLAKKD